MLNSCSVCHRTYKSLSQHLRQSVCGRLAVAEGICPKIHPVAGTGSHNPHNTMLDSTAKLPEQPFTSDDNDFSLHDPFEYESEDLFRDEDQMPHVPAGAIVIEDGPQNAVHTCTDQEIGYVRLLSFVEQQISISPGSEMKFPPPTQEERPQSTVFSSRTL